MRDLGGRRRVASETGGEWLRARRATCVGGARDWTASSRDTTCDRARGTTRDGSAVVLATVLFCAAGALQVVHTTAERSPAHQR